MPGSLKTNSFGTMGEGITTPRGKRGTTWTFIVRRGSQPVNQPTNHRTTGFETTIVALLEHHHRDQARWRSPYVQTWNSGNDDDPGSLGCKRLDRRETAARSDLLEAARRAATPSVPRSCRRRDATRPSYKEKPWPRGLPQ